LSYAHHEKKTKAKIILGYENKANRKSRRHCEAAFKVRLKQSKTRDCFVAALLSMT